VVDEGFDQFGKACAQAMIASTHCLTHAQQTGYILERLHLPIRHSSCVNVGNARIAAIN
jgi:hypothetical protein